MLKKFFCSLSLTLAMLVSCVTLPFVQSSTIHAATNQGQSNGIVYVNKKLGFSLTIPKNWEGNYEIEEGNNFVRFLFKYKGKKNDAIPPLFSISYAPNDGREKGLRWIGKFSTKNDMAYYYSYDAISFYQEDIPPGEEQDMVLAMRNQISDIFSSFKMLEPVAVEKEANADTVGEAKPKDKAEGNTTKEVANQETINGIKYVNEKLGFILILPQSWKDHYVIKENENGSITFKFKFDGKVYEDIFLFDIFIKNKELSKEEQETLGDVGVLGIKNGKTYLIAPNVGLYFYNNYDKYFTSVPKEGRSVIEAMSKQMKDIGFKVLEGAVAEEAKEEKLKGKTAEEKKEDTTSGNSGDTLQLIPKYNWIEEWAKSRGHIPTLKYTFDEVKGKGFFPSKPSHNIYYVIKTPVDNIRTEIINNRVSKSTYMGINGGFFDSTDYQKTPTRGLSISYYNGGTETEVYNYNGTPENPVARPTFVTYYDKDLKITKAEIISAKSMDVINNHFKNRDHNHHDNQIIINAIGGVTYSIESYNIFDFLSPYHSWWSRRTVIGYREENDIVYAYLIISKTSTDIAMLKADLNAMGFNKENSMMLDGDGSTSMRIQKHNGDWIVDVGSEWGYPANRHVFNMVRLINTGVKKE